MSVPDSVAAEAARTLSSEEAIAFDVTVGVRHTLGRALADTVAAASERGPRTVDRGCFRRSPSPMATLRSTPI